MRGDEYTEEQERQVLSEIIPRLLLNSKKKVGFVNRKQVMKLEGLISTKVEEIGNRFLYLSYDLFDDLLFSRGATPLKVQPIKRKPDLSVELSFFHRFSIYESSKIKMGECLEEIDSEVIHQVSDDDFFVVNYLKKNLSFSYHG